MNGKFDEMLEVQLEGQGLTKAELEAFPAEVDALFDEMLEVQLEGQGLTRKELDEAGDFVNAKFDEMLDVKLKAEGLTREDVGMGKKKITLERKDLDECKALIKKGMSEKMEAKKA